MEPNKKHDRKEQRKLEKEKKQQAKIEKKQKEIDDIEKFTKEMEELMKSIQDQVGDENIKVIQVKKPEITLGGFFFDLVMALLLNTLLIVGTSGFITLFIWDNILDLIYFSIYFTLIEKTISFIFMKKFVELIIKSLGLATYIPMLISLAIILFFPVFVIIENVFGTIFGLILVFALRSYINTFIHRKMLTRKMRNLR
jgi:hypothetical protein